MKKPRPTKRKTKTRAPKIKTVKLPKAVVAHVEVPRGMIPAIVPGPDPHVMRIVPLPADKPQSWMQWFFGPDRK